MLRLNQVYAYYGKSCILHGVTFGVNQGEVVTLMGRNGMGKTTTLKSIMGLVLTHPGSIEYKGLDILGKKPYQIARMGIGYVPQGRYIFSSLNVAENLELTSGNQNISSLEWVLNIFPVIKSRLRHKGNELSGGEQQMLAIARILLRRPEFVLLDEPSEGLAPLLIVNILEALHKVKESGITMLMAEANTNIAASLGDRHEIIDQGVIVYEASTKELNDRELQRKFFAI